MGQASGVGIVPNFTVCEVLRFRMEQLNNLLELIQVKHHIVLLVISTHSLKMNQGIGSAHVIMRLRLLLLV